MEGHPSSPLQTAMLMGRNATVLLYHSRDHEEEPQNIIQVHMPEHLSHLLVEFEIRPVEQHSHRHDNTHATHSIAMKLGMAKN